MYLKFLDMKMLQMSEVKFSPRENRFLIIRNGIVLCVVLFISLEDRLIKLETIPW